MVIQAALAGQDTQSSGQFGEDLVNVLGVEKRRHGFPVLNHLQSTDFIVHRLVLGVERRHPYAFKGAVFGQQYIGKDGAFIHVKCDRNRKGKFFESLDVGFRLGILANGVAAHRHPGLHLVRQMMLFRVQNGFEGQVRSRVLVGIKLLECRGIRREFKWPRHRFVSRGYGAVLGGSHDGPPEAATQAAPRHLDVANHHIDQFAGQIGVGAAPAIGNITLDI